MPQGFPRPKRKIPAHKKRIMEEYKKRFLDKKKRGEKVPPADEKKVKPMRPFPENRFKKKKALPMAARPMKKNIRRAK